MHTVYTDTSWLAIRKAAADFNDNAMVVIFSSVTGRRIVVGESIKVLPLKAGVAANETKVVGSWRTLSHRATLSMSLVVNCRLGVVATAAPRFANG